MVSFKRTHNKTRAKSPSSVLRARLRMETTEGLLLEPCADGSWRMLLKRAKRFAAGEVLPLVAALTRRDRRQ